VKHKKILLAVLGGWLLALVLPPAQVMGRFRGKRD
jgi:hypothetical protein